MRGRFVLLTWVVVVCACRNEPRLSEEAAAEQKAAKERVELRPLNAIDGFGYASGNYQTSHNHPVIFADVGEKKFVLMGKRARGEVPLSEAAKAIQAYEDLLLNHGYSPNGKPPRDDNTYVMVDGGKMVVVRMDQIFPQMPRELSSHFTSSQYQILTNTSGIELHAVFAGYYGDRPERPAMWAYSDGIVVGGKNVRREFPTAQASEAFKEYEALLKRTGVIP